MYNEKGTVEYGKSKLAGKRAILESAVTRFILPAPYFFIPAFSVLFMRKMRLWPRSPVFIKLGEISISLAAGLIALPMSVALFN